MTVTTWAPFASSTISLSLTTCSTAFGVQAATTFPTITTSFVYVRIPWQIISIAFPPMMLV